MKHVVASNPEEREIERERERERIVKNRESEQRAPVERLSVAAREVHESKTRA